MANYVKHHINKSSESQIMLETYVQHLVYECDKMAQKEYERRHDNVAKKVYWDLCNKIG